MLPPLDSTPSERKLNDSLATRHDLTPAKVRDNYADRLVAEEVTEEQIAEVTWLLGYAKDQRLSIGGLAKAAEIDAGTISKLFSGTYEAGLSNVATRIEGFRSLVEQRQAINKADFVETSLSRIIADACRTALLFQTIVPIYGDSQIGKTAALTQQALRDRYQRTIYVRMPEEGHLTDFLVALNKALKESTKTNGHFLKNRPIEVITGSNLLIIDEVHQTTLVPGRGSARVNTIEYLRRLWDATQCGMVLCGTNAFRDEVETGQHKAMLEQLRRRGLPPVQLPSMLPRDDMDAIAKAYGLPKADDHTHEIRRDLIKRTGLRAYTNFLKSAAKLAEKERKAMTWQHFIRANDIYAKLSSKRIASDKTEEASA